MRSLTNRHLLFATVLSSALAAVFGSFCLLNEWQAADEREAARRWQGELLRRLEQVEATASSQERALSALREEGGRLAVQSSAVAPLGLRLSALEAPVPEIGVVPAGPDAPDLETRVRRLEAWCAAWPEAWWLGLGR